MKIGILILAHSNALQLRMLVDRLKQNFVLFIHLDQKSDIPSDLFSGEDQVFVIKKYPIHWGSFNMLQATLELFKQAYEQDCNYFMLISGSDLPLKSNREIISQITLNPETNYMTYEKMPRPVWPHDGGMDRIRLYWEKIGHPDHPGLLNRLCSLGRLIQKKTGLTRNIFPIDFYGGSQWVNLSREATGYILDFMAQYPAYLESFRYTRASDEIWLQTLVMNSQFAEKTANDNKRYIDWVSGPDRPKTLTGFDYERLMSSDAFFARKFSFETDKEIIEKLISKGKIHG